MIFRRVEDKDFDQIVKLYHAYLDWQRTQPGPQEKYLTADEMRDVYHRRKRSSQALNYPPTRPVPFHFGYVAEENGEIIAYYEYGGYPQKDKCAAAYIAVWKDASDPIIRKRNKKIAEELFVWTWGELKKEGFLQLIGHMSKRMKKYEPLDFLSKYAQRIVPETVEGLEGDVQYQRDL